ncbi:MAG: uracil-DNA glycosylase family protein [Opitutales bacterium]
MRELVQGLIAELKDWRRQGTDAVYLSDATVADVHRLAAQATPGKAQALAESTTQVEAPPAAVPSKKGPAVARKAAELPPLSLGQPDPAPANRSKATEDPAVAQGLPPGCEPVPEPTPFDLPDGDKQTRWDWLREKVLNCPVCNAHLSPQGKVVFGVGSLDAEIFFCGEAPGEQEEKQGEPFVGPAGELLNKVIRAMGLRREEVYIGNILNWRPEQTKRSGNRKPGPAEMAFGLPYLRAQIEIVQPKVIVALGLTAVEGLLGSGQKWTLRAARGKWHTFDATPVRATFHPSYILRQEAIGPEQARKTKRQHWEDVLAVMERLEMPITEKQRGFFS